MSANREANSGSHSAVDSITRLQRSKGNQGVLSMLAAHAQATGGASANVIHRKPATDSRQKAVPAWSVRRIGTSKEFLIDFAAAVSEQDVLRVIFVDGVLPPKYALQATSGPAHWKITLASGAMYSGLLTTDFINQAIAASTLSLTADESAAIHARAEASLNTYLDFMGMTVREALQKYPTRWWGRKGDYFVYIGFDAAESDRRILAVSHVSKDPVINRDIEYWLDHGLSLREAWHATEEQWRQIVVAEIGAFGTALSAAPGGGFSGTGQIRSIKQLDTAVEVTSTAIGAYETGKVAIEHAKNDDAGELSLEQKVKRMQISLSKDGGLKEVASNIHGLRDDLKGQAVVIVQIEMGDDKQIHYAAAVNSGAGYGEGWTQQQRTALQKLGIIVVEPFGKELVHAEINLRAWIDAQRKAGIPIKVRKWGISAGPTGAHICVACRQFIQIEGGVIEEHYVPPARTVTRGRRGR